jgi:hypothetical protein
LGWKRGEDGFVFDIIFAAFFRLTKQRHTILAGKSIEAALAPTFSK